MVIVNNITTNGAVPSADRPPLAAQLATLTYEVVGHWQVRRRCAGASSMTAKPGLLGPATRMQRPTTWSSLPLLTRLTSPQSRSLVRALPRRCSPRKASP